MSGVEINSQLPEFQKSVDKRGDLLLAKMSSDILVLSQAKVPKKDGDLAASGKKEKRKTKSHRVSYGETLSDPYAGYQERGRRKDGSRVVRNYTTAGTGKNYLKDSGSRVISKANQYAKMVMGRASA